MLSIRDLTKVYRRGVRANDGITMSVAAGEVVGLLGHNGAGKTTLLDQIVGLVEPTSGEISLHGRDPVTDPAYARRTCSFQPQSQAPLTGVTVRQAIEIVGRLRGGRKRQVRAATDRLLGVLEIEEWADRPAERVSGGVRRLTAFGMAVVHPGDLVMLDEPTNDVDPMRRRLLSQEVRRLSAAGHAVVIVTHNIAEAERDLDRAVILDRGRVVSADTELAGLEERYLRLTGREADDVLVP